MIIACKRSSGSSSACMICMHCRFYLMGVASPRRPIEIMCFFTQAASSSLCCSFAWMVTTWTHSFPLLLEQNQIWFHNSICMRMVVFVMFHGMGLMRMVFVWKRMVSECLCIVFAWYVWLNDTCVYICVCIAPQSNMYGMICMICMYDMYDMYVCNTHRRTI